MIRGGCPIAAVRSGSDSSSSAEQVSAARPARPRGPFRGNPSSQEFVFGRSSRRAGPPSPFRGDAGLRSGVHPRNRMFTGQAGINPSSGRIQGTGRGGAALHEPRRFLSCVPRHPGSGVSLIPVNESGRRREPLRRVGAARWFRSSRPRQGPGLRSGRPRFV